jgi:ferredoxin
MRIKNVIIYYFSGTGNTLLIVKKMEEVFRKLNIKISIVNILHAEAEQVSLDKTIGIAFPVACLSTYPLVWDFLNNLPDGQGTEVFMVDTMAGFSGLVGGQVRRLLLNKNYSPLGAKEIIMPTNLNYKEINEEKNSIVIEKGTEQAKYFVHDLVYGISKWKALPVLPKLMNKLNMEDKAWSHLAKKIRFSIDNIKCIRCGLCFKACPVDNIEMEEYPEYLDKCQFCLRCISFCPTEAIGIRNKENFYPYRAVEAEEILK